MARRSNNSKNDATPSGIQGAKLEPIRVVEREITTPDGRVVRVDVPVYPPFRLDSRPKTPAPADTPRRRKEATRRTG